MARLDMGVLVLGMIGGLLCFVLAYGHTVWRARRSAARGHAPTRFSSMLSAVSTTGVMLAVAVLILAISNRSLPEVEGLLSGEDLFAVKPRVGLVASYVALGPDVHKGEVLLRFRGATDDQQQMDGGPRLREEDLDPELVRHARAADLAYRQSLERERQLMSERDAIEREAAQQRIGLVEQRFRVAQDKRNTEGQIAQTQANLSSERVQLNATKTLVEQQLVARMDLTKKQETVTVLEEQDAQLKGRSSLLGQEMAKTHAQLGEMERIYRHQMRAREEELKTVEATLEDAERERARWQAALAEQRAKQGVVAAPFDGRIGFREPSPASLPVDGGPLLVQYRPGKIFVVVRLDSGLSSGARHGLESQFRLAAEPSPSFAGGRPTLLRQGGDSVELRIPCDPPDRLLRQLALGGAVPVRAQLRLPVTSAPGLWLAIALVGVALAARIVRAIVQRRSAVVEVATPAPATAPAEIVRFDAVAPAQPSSAMVMHGPPPPHADEADGVRGEAAPDEDADPVDSNRQVGS
jgi:hypothetical protein